MSVVEIIKHDVNSNFKLIEVMYQDGSQQLELVEHWINPEIGDDGILFKIKLDKSNVKKIDEFYLKYLNSLSRTLLNF